MVTLKRYRDNYVKIDCKEMACGCGSVAELMLQVSLMDMLDKGLPDLGLTLGLEVWLSGRAHATGVTYGHVRQACNHWSLPYSLAPGRKYAGRSGSRYTVYDVVFHPDALALARGHERFRAMLDATALEAVEQQFGVRLDRRNAKTLKIKYKGMPEAAVLRTPLPGGVPAQPEGEPPELLPDLQYPYPYRYPELGLGEGPPPGDRSPPCTAFPGCDTESRAGSPGLCGDLNAQTCEEQEGRCHDASGSAMGGSGAGSIGPLCPPLQCNQDEDSLTLLIQVPQIQPQSLHGDLSPLRYNLCFSTQDSGYCFTLQFAPENKLSTREPVISISLNNAVIVLAKSPESRGHWREWYCGLNTDSLEERLFLDEENVNEFLEEVLHSPLTQERSLAPPPLIEVLQVTDEKIQIHAKLQECSGPDGLQGEEKGVSEGCPLSEKGDTEHFTTSTTDSDSSVAVEAVKTNTCGSAVGPQHICPDLPHMLSGKPQQPEAKTDPEFIKENDATYSAEEKENIKEPVITKEKELDGDHLSSLLDKTAVQDKADFESIKETNMQDGSVQIIKDHTTQCAFSFQNSLLYDLD
ncbi:protein kintoun isoform X1 [Cricetulus griseus]|uniref:protein kintoun isoform X1 n=1 Tax=Cricetulus griseus TaxID=10029 RepID=UPI0015C2C574|nr:protein kintoun isoform X1 [Cricetulus griseus]